MTTPRIGQHVIVRGVRCRIVRVLPLGTVDVESISGLYAWRVSGLAIRETCQPATAGCRQSNLPAFNTL